MPIRLNLLAEAQALEELRRRDPVKRAIWVGAFLVFVVLLWSSSLQLKAMVAKSDLSRIEGRIAAHSNAFQVVSENKNQLADISHKLGSLRQMATNRFLNGTVLNALQQATVDEVQLVRFRAEEAYILSEAIKPKTNGNRIIPGKPATITEKVVLTLDARDGGANPGDAIDKFKKAIEQSPYFQAALCKTNEARLINYSPTQTGPDGKPFILFTLECRFPEKTR